MLAVERVTPITPEALEAMGAEGDRYELIRGVLREVKGMGLGHGVVGGRLLVSLGAFVRQHGLGEVLISDTRFVIPGVLPSVVAPDISFITSARLPLGELPEGYSRIVPDLVVEVVSPSQYEPEVLDKVAVYMSGGVRLLWVVRPAPRTITVFRPTAPVEVLGENDVLNGGEVVPGFLLAVRDVFWPGTPG